MRKYLSHVAMLLLGITLTVAAYETRRVVKSTARALTAATSMSTAANRRSETDELRERLAHAEQALAARKAVRPKSSERKGGKRGGGGGGGERRAGQPTPQIGELGDLTSRDRLNAIRSRQKLRLQPAQLPAGEAQPPVAPAEVDPVDELPEDLVDTGVPEAPE